MRTIPGPPAVNLKRGLVQGNQRLWREAPKSRQGQEKEERLGQETFTKMTQILLLRAGGIPFVIPPTGRVVEVFEGGGQKTETREMSGISTDG
jgi:hypothetical protein